ncbi:hypothetical protein [Chitinimonas sp.]|uniref:hypothetical protein n=1 Tax=Chitinimonas sp. TaxID=1934313 RepID=UPI0035B08D3A
MLKTLRLPLLLLQRLPLHQPLQPRRLKPLPRQRLPKPLLHLPVLPWRTHTASKPCGVAVTSLHVAC